ncbi:MAG: carotenoid oxygenase family protein, partial [Synechococcus sp. SB0669_bin_7]|nr:carotenoid oxygenase family protein [Synechococcus sp. SB0669_bin_7]
MTISAADQQAAPSTLAAPLANPADNYSQTDWNSAYGNVTTELEGWVETVEGAIPPALQGTLYRNGPGRLERGGQWVQHPFDGDGMILAVGFHQGRAYLRNRFVRTAGWLEEEAAGRWRYRGVFGTQKPGGILANALDLRLKNIANTNVVDWGGRLLALWEAASPTA